MKDFYDLHWMSHNMEFDRATLLDAIRATFARRGTVLPNEPPLALTSEFGEERTKEAQWNAFLRKGRLEGEPFPQIIGRLSDFLLPLLESQTEGAPSVWTLAEGWTDAPAAP